MQFLGVVPLIVAFALFGLFQARFVDGYLDQYGGPSRAERQRLFGSNPRRYVQLLLSGRPFGLRAMFSAVDDREVEHRRRHMLASLALILVAAAFSVWMTLSAPAGTFQFVIVMGGAATALVWGAFLVRSELEPGWLRVAAVVGVVSGVVVAIVGIAFRG